MRKLFGKKNILSLIFGLLMMLPFFSIIARCIYVQSNSNAFVSYYGETINQSEMVNITTNELQVSHTYYLITPTNISYERKEGNTEISVSNVILDNVNKNISSLRFYVVNNTTNLTIQGIGTDSFIIYNTQMHELSFTFNGINNELYVSDINTILYEQIFNNYSFLDNVFDYSLASFVEENNFGIDFFQWFDNTFLTQSGHNMVYINFANWYLNYAMIVSTAYILFLAMIWFVYFARNLFEKFMNYDGGGF